MSAAVTVLTKEMLIEFIRDLPDNITIADAIEELQILAAIHEGQQAAKEGRVTPHEEVRRRFESWTKTA